MARFNRVPNVLL